MIQKAFEYIDCDGDRLEVYKGLVTVRHGKIVASMELPKQALQELRDWISRELEKDTASGL